jgi:transcriptional regulator with XRE-family HTH domain
VAEKLALAPEAQKRLALLGEHIRLARRALGISRAKLAEIIGMHPMNYAKIERGKKNVTFDTLLRIADGLGLDLSVKLVKRRIRER